MMIGFAALIPRLFILVICVVVFFIGLQLFRSLKASKFVGRMSDDLTPASNAKQAIDGMDDAQQVAERSYETSGQKSEQLAQQREALGKKLSTKGKVVKDDLNEG